MLLHIELIALNTLVVQCSHAWHNDVVVGIAIIGDQGAAVHMAGELDLIGIDLIDRCVV